MDHSIAAILGTNRDGSASAESSRALLTTVLGELVLPSSGSAWTRTLLMVMEGLGVQPKASRQALARMHDRGWLTKQRSGRETQWTLTEESSTLLGSGAERIYGFGQRARRWDGRWLVLLASVPAEDRRVRHRMTVGLRWAGFGSLGQGVWVSPWVSHEPAVVDLLRNLDVNATSFVAELGALGDGGDLAEQAWDLPALASEYRAFLEDTTSTSAASGVDAAVELTALVHRWRRFPSLDPDLPAQLLPDDWPGRDAVSRFGNLRSSLQDRALDWWSVMESDG